MRIQAPAFLECHTQQLRQCGGQFGPGTFKLHDLHKQTLYHIVVYGDTYSGGVDEGLTPLSLLPVAAAAMQRIGFAHKQSTLDKDAYCAQNNILQVFGECKLKQGLNIIIAFPSR